MIYYTKITNIDSITLPQFLYEKPSVCYNISNCTSTSTCTYYPHIKHVHKHSNTCTCTCTVLSFKEHTNANRPMVEAFLASLVEGVWCIILRVCTELEVIVLLFPPTPVPALVSYDTTGLRIKRVTSVDALCNRRLQRSRGSRSDVTVM